MFAHQLHILDRQYSALGDNDKLFGYVWQQVQRSGQTHLKSTQVAIIDAYQWSRQVQSRFQFIRTMHLDQHCHAKLVRQCLEFAHLIQRQRCNYKQYSIGPHRSRLVDLIFIHHKIFTQHR